MDINFWNASIRILAIAAGIVFGSAAISSACWVWVRKQVYGYGGSALSGAGVVLLGLSIWRSVVFDVGASGLSLKLQAQLDQMLHAIDLQGNSLVAQERSLERTVTTVTRQANAITTQAEQAEVIRTELQRKIDAFDVLAGRLVEVLSASRESGPQRTPNPQAVTDCTNALNAPQKKLFDERAKGLDQRMKSALAKKDIKSLKGIFDEIQSNINASSDALGAASRQCIKWILQ